MVTLHPMEEPEEVHPQQVMAFIQEASIHSIAGREGPKQEEEQQPHFQLIRHYPAPREQEELQPHIMAVVAAVEVIMVVAEDQIMEEEAEEAAG